MGEPGLGLPRRLPLLLPLLLVLDLLLPGERVGDLMRRR
jgi:hypothetical protein